MLHGFDERFPVHVLLWPVRVQGETCAAEVAAAIRGFNALPAGGALPRPDVLIVARGGGSLEDLWGFNEETVVRAVAASAIPLISAVGHETDWTLIDLAADARAPTPTKAAEWAVPRHSELVEQTGKLALRLGTAPRRAIDGMRAHLRAAARGLPRRGDLLALPRQRFDAVDRRLGRALLANTRAHGMRLARCTSRLHPRCWRQDLTRTRDRLDGSRPASQSALARRSAPAAPGWSASPGARPAADRPAHRAMRRAPSRRSAGAAPARRWRNIAAHRRHLDGCGKLLASLSYHGVLQRGYALVRDSDGQALRSVAQIAAGQRLDIELADGRVDAQALGDGARLARHRDAARSTTAGSRREAPAVGPRWPGLAVLMPVA